MIQLFISGDNRRVAALTALLFALSSLSFLIHIWVSTIVVVGIRDVPELVDNLIDSIMMPALYAGMSFMMLGFALAVWLHPRKLVRAVFTLFVLVAATIMVYTFFVSRGVLGLAIG